MGSEDKTKKVTKKVVKAGAAAAVKGGGKAIAKNFILMSVPVTILVETMLFLLGKAVEMLIDKHQDKKDFKKHLANLSVDHLKLYIPDVYQPDIYAIDYDKIRAAGIRLISFDVDAIADSFANKIIVAIPFVKLHFPQKAKDLFSTLKEAGFTVTLLTNASKTLGKESCRVLQANDYIAKAKKPETEGFEKMMERYNVTPNQMTHIGCSMRQDIYGGNNAGITTCLVRRVGISRKIGKFFLKCVGLDTKGHLIRRQLWDELGLWRKHHVHEKNDQYYQIDEVPSYLVHT